MSEVESRYALAAVLATEGGETRAHVIADHVKRLVRLAGRVQAITERECNGVVRYDAKLKRSVAEWNENDQEHADKELAHARNQAEVIAKVYGAEVVRCGGDPRGFTLALKLKSGRTNSFGGEFWGVPT